MPERSLSSWQQTLGTDRQKTKPSVNCSLPVQPGEHCIRGIISHIPYQTGGYIVVSFSEHQNGCDLTSHSVDRLACDLLSRKVSIPSL